MSNVTLLSRLQPTLLNQHLYWSAEVHHRESTARAAGTMDAAMGCVVPANVTVTKVTCRFLTADSGGATATAIKLQKNGSDVTSATVSVSVGSTTGTFGGTPFAVVAGDVLLANVTTAGGTTKGNGLSILYEGYFNK